MRGIRLAISAGLLALVLATFGAAVGFEFLNLDDDAYVTENRYIRAGLTAETVRWAFTAFHSGHWHPLTWLSLAADVQLFGVQPGPMHGVNVALHTTNVVLLFWVLQAATGTIWRSAVVAALFGLHPLRVESVAWVTERKDVLSVLFWIASMGAYVHYVRRPGTACYVGLVLLFVLGLLAKPMLVTLPLMLLLMDYWPLGRWDPGTGAVARARPLVIEKLPLLALALIASAITSASQRTAGATVALDVITVPQRIWNAAWGYVRYLGKTVWPTDLAIFYPLEVVPASRGAAAVAGLGLVTAGALACWRRWPFVTVGWLWWTVTLLPVIGLVQIGGQAIADRFTYVPTIGLFVAVVWLAHEGLRRWAWGAAVGGAAATAAVLACLVLTPTQLAHWQSTRTIFRHALAVTTGNYMAHNNLGLALARAGERDGAFYHYSEAVRINPTWPEAQNNLGTAYGERGDYVRAGVHFEAALRRRPTFASAHNNLGTVHARQGNYAAAAESYGRAVTLAPDNFDARYGLADALQRTGDLAGAQRHYATLIRMRPDAQHIAARLAAVEQALGTTGSR